MAAYTTRKTVFGVKAESVSGTPVDLASGSDIIGIQDGFELNPSFETIDNNELSPNVAAKAPIIGIEKPTSQINHYIRHSGVSGTEPNYGPLLKAAMGDSVASFSEKLTTSGSTAGTSAARAIVKLASGGSSFERGHCVLIKDGSNGYSLRNVLSVSTNDLTLLFNLTAAPASGIGTGQPILYKPADAPAALSLWCFRANGAAKEVISGALVSEMTIDGTAGQPLNGSFSLDGVGYYFNPIRIASSDIYIDFNDGGVKAATITAGLYKDPNELATAIQDSMNTVSSGFTVIYNNVGADAGKFTLTKASGTFTLLFATGANLANSISDKIGFAATDLSAVLTYTSATVQDWSSPFAGVSDSNVNPLIVKNNEVMIGTFDRFACAGAQSFSFKVAKDIGDVPDICAESGIEEKLITKRTTSMDCVLTLAKHDALSFTQFRQGDTVQFAFNGGVKVGGNWVAGRCVNIAIFQAKISSYQVTDTNGVVTIAMTLSAFGLSDGLGEVYMNVI